MTPKPGVTPEPPMTRSYLTVLIVQALVLLALWAFQQRFSL
jgi:hypothetical protein